MELVGIIKFLFKLIKVYKIKNPLRLVQMKLKNLDNKILIKMEYNY